MGMLLTAPVPMPVMKGGGYTDQYIFALRSWMCFGLAVGGITLTQHETRMQYFEELDDDRLVESSFFCISEPDILD